MSRPRRELELVEELAGVRRRVERLFVERLGRDVPADDADLVASGLLDSLAIVELIVALEDDFGITIDVVELDLEDLRSIAAITRLVADLEAEQRDPSEEPADD